MLSHVQLRDFKPDVVICPNCTQHLMGVRDVQWAADHMAFTYGCAGCGHQIERSVADDAILSPAEAEASSAEAENPSAETCSADAEAAQESAPSDADVTVMEDHPFPFRKRGESRFFMAAANEASESETQRGLETQSDFETQAEATAADAGHDDIADNSAPGDDADDEIADSDAPAPFASLLLLPPKPWLESWLDTPVLTRRFSAEERVPLTPKQVFDTERRDSDRRDSLLSDASTCTRASALLRDVTIFNL